MEQGLQRAISIGSVALFALVFAYKFAQIVSFALRSEQDTVMVLVAVRDLHPGVTITSNDLYAVRMLPKHLPDGVFLSPEHAIGRIPHERILANEVLRAERLVDPDAKTGMHALIPPEKRAISLLVSDAAALSGMLSPGSIVDVLVTEDSAEVSRDDLPRSDTVLQGVPVLDVRMDVEEKTAVTLLVSPVQAERVARAETVGVLHLSVQGGSEGARFDPSREELDGLRERLTITKRPAKRHHPSVVEPRQCRHVTTTHGCFYIDEQGNPCD